MAWTKEDLDRLDAALLDDTIEVQFADGRRVKKQSKADMIALRKMIADAVGSASSSTRVRSTVGRIYRR